MDEADSPPPGPTRTPEKADLIRLCQELNRLGARYIVVGSWAMRHQGLERPVPDIDFLIAEDPENQRFVLEALEILPEKACRELKEEDLRDFVEVRVSDEIPIDLMTRLCGISYSEGRAQIEWAEEPSTGIVPETATEAGEGGAEKSVRIPYASKVLLWRTKQTHHEADEPDRAYLREHLKGILTEEELHRSPLTEPTSQGFLGRVWRKIF